MKTIPMAVITVTMLLVVLVKPVIVSAQYQTPPPLGTLTNENNTPNFNNTNVYDKTYYQTHPILGWNWGGNGSNFDNALHTNTAHTKFLYHPIHWFPTNYINEFNNTVFPDSTRLILYLDLKGGSTDDTIRKYYQPMVNCIAQQIEPTIAVQESQAFTPRPADKEGGVFGFKTKNKVRILSDTTALDYPRVLLDKDSITTPALILSTLWRTDVLRFL